MLHLKIELFSLLLFCPFYESIKNTTRGWCFPRNALEALAVSKVSLKHIQYFTALPHTLNEHIGRFKGNHIKNLLFKKKTFPFTTVCCHISVQQGHKRK